MNVLICLHSSYEKEFRFISKTLFPSIFALILVNPILFQVLFILSYAFTPKPIKPLIYKVSEIKRLLFIFFVLIFLKLVCSDKSL